MTRLFDILDTILRLMPQAKLFSTKYNGQWQSLSTAQFVEQTQRLATGLKAKGITRGDNVVIITYNRTEFNLLDFALQYLGAVSVPLYPNISAKDISYITHHAEAVMVVCSTEEMVTKAELAIADLPTKPEIITLDAVEGYTQLSDFIATEADPQIIAKARAQIQGSDLATIIYTSGTTGFPKGVMLSHTNILSNVNDVATLLYITKGDRVLSFLPINHIYERTLVYVYLFKGVSIYYAEGIDKLGENLREVKPHMFTCVPRLLEKVYEKILVKGYALKGIKRQLFFWAHELGMKWDPVQDHGWWYNFQLSVANALVFNKWREGLGGNVKIISVGSAALQPRLIRIFNAAKIMTLEGYGMTEASPVIATNRMDPGRNRVGTVGPALPHVEIKLAEDGEVLVKGPNVMMGYYNNPSQTAEAIDADGWLHTGDVGEWVDNQFLKLTDRKKELFKTSGGSYIAPQKLENMLKESLLIENALVVGEGQKYPAAIIILSQERLADWCHQHNLPFTTAEVALESPAVQEKLAVEIDKVNIHLTSYEKVKKWVLKADVWSIDAGELTPTMKLKRKTLTDRYYADIQRLYT